MDQLQKEQFLSIIEKFQSGTATAEEIESLNTYYRAFDIRGSFTETLNDTDREQLKQELLSGIHSRIASVPIDQRKAVKLNTYFRIASAAAILLVVGAGLLFYRYKSKPAQTIAYYANDIAPGRNSATLTLASGKKIVLSNAAKGNLADEAGITVNKTADGKLVYIVNNASTPEINSSNTLSTARGEQYQVILPDGTHVWLNAASSLKYPASFARLNQRQVELTGEAYFEVAKDKSHPFIVKTEKQEVKVLGTHFNITAYHDDAAIKTTLLEGSVQVFAVNGGQAKIKPGQAAYLSNNMLKVNYTDLDEAVAWKNGEFMFSNEPLESIMGKVARWYDVNIKFQSDDMKNKTFDGTITRFEKVSKVLKMLELTGHVHFKIEGKTITVMN